MILFQKQALNKTKRDLIQIINYVIVRVTLSIFYNLFHAYDVPFK